MTFETEELEDAVCNIVQIIKQILELSGTRLKVAGGLALRRYLDQHQPADGIHFVAELTVSLDFFAVTLLEHPLSPFTYEKQVLYYQNPAGRSIPIKISKPLYCNQVELPLIHNIGYGCVPYITWQELDRIYPDQSRSVVLDVRKRRREAREGRALKSRHMMDTRRQVSDQVIPKHSAVISTAKDVAAESVVDDRGRPIHRRVRSESCLRSPSFTMTTK